MKLLLLFPLLLVSGVSAYNLFTTADSIFLYAMHTGVLLLCLAMIGLLIRSLFTVTYVEVEDQVEIAEPVTDEEFVLQHS